MGYSQLNCSSLKRCNVQFVPHVLQFCLADNAFGLDGRIFRGLMMEHFSSLCVSGLACWKKQFCAQVGRLRREEGSPF